MYVLCNKSDNSRNNLYFVSLGIFGFPIITDNIKEAKFFNSKSDAESMRDQCAFTFEVMKI